MEMSSREEHITSKSALFSGNTSRKRLFLIVIGAFLVLAAIIALGVGLGVGLHDDSSIADKPLSERRKRAEDILSNYPLIDGHNDLPWRYRTLKNNSVESVDLNADWPGTHTNIPKLREGKVGAQFWASFALCTGQYKDAERMFLDQIDVIKRYVAKYSDVFTLVTTPQEILDEFNKGKIPSLIGLEGGHAIRSSLGNLRMFYDLGARYMTLTHNCNTPWADSVMADKDNIHEFNGLSPFGELIVKEMNRLGMMVDLSHVSKQTMEDAIRVSRAPVIFSHSSVYSLCAHNRNVQDSVLNLLKENNGVIMINFYTLYINCSGNTASIGQVADHIDYVKNLIGVDYVGIGADYDGVELFPTGLEDVSTYPSLFAELLRRGWSSDDMEKLAGRNLIRVFQEVERIRDSLSAETPYEELIDESTWKNKTCRTEF